MSTPIYPCLGALVGDTEMRNRLPGQFWTVMEQLEKKISK